MMQELLAQRWALSKNYNQNIQIFSFAATDKMHSKRGASRENLTPLFFG
jgi:hypothetical protein